MNRVLLAAEANKIQDLIFRSSKLREVTGGSDALERFWAALAKLAAQVPYAPSTVLVHAGGQLRVLFEGAGASSRAQRFARDLADVYAMRVGGRISIAVAEGDGMEDAELWKLAATALATRKESGGLATAVPGFPYVQPCSSCGVEPAVTVAAEDRSEVCASCADRRAGRDTFREAFLTLLKARPEPKEEPEVNASLLGADAEEEAGWSAAEALQDLPSELEVGSLDRRGRVAYLLADGNGFGVMFGEAAKQGLAGTAKLSAAAASAGASALAAATRRLLAQLPAGLHRKDPGDRTGALSPVLPLITGGDDVFALIPAPWAVWFAQEFARAFTAHMQATAGQEVTVSCALVVCKDTFPYRFAHEVGEAALKEAKRVARASPGHSVVRAVELRSTLSDAQLGPPGEYGVFSLPRKPQAEPASAPDEPAGPDPDRRKAPLDVQSLFAGRIALSKPGRKRRHQLEELFSSTDRGEKDWLRRADWLLDREGDEDGALRRALSQLADGSKQLVCTPSLAPPGAMAGRSSAVVDLLHLWDYLADPAEQEELR